MPPCALPHGRLRTSLAGSVQRWGSFRRWQTWGVPTTHRRHPATETPDRDQPARLLSRLSEEGDKSFDPSAAERQNNRLVAVRQISGSYTGLYEPGYLGDLRSEWPA